jgi:hypothetical protein
MLDNGKPLTQSGVGERIWALLGENMDEFKRELQVYFARGYPGYSIHSWDAQRRIVWLRDDR